MTVHSLFEKSQQVKKKIKTAGDFSKKLG